MYGERINGDIRKKQIKKVEIIKISTLKLNGEGEI